MSARGKSCLEMEKPDKYGKRGISVPEEYARSNRKHEQRGSGVLDVRVFDREGGLCLGERERVEKSSAGRE